MEHGQPKIALVTARPRPEVNVDHDMPLLHQAVTAEGAVATVTAWDDPEVDWSEFDLAVVRSPWDYSWRSAEFMRWVAHCSRQTRLANDPSVMNWNANKEYLRELFAANVPTVPTSYLSPGAPIRLPDYNEFVVKPAVGAGARFAARYTRRELSTAEAHVQRIHADGVTVMIQPYLHAIDVTGERALVFINGGFMHAIRKRAVLAPGLRYDAPRDAHPGTEPWKPSTSELGLAEQALAAVPFSQGLLYARVDMVDDSDGRPVLTELELVEPGLYLRFHPGSPTTVAKAITRAANSAQLSV